MKRIGFFVAVVVAFSLAGLLFGQSTRMKVTDLAAPVVTGARVLVVTPSSPFLQFATLDPAGTIVLDASNTLKVPAVSGPIYTQEFFSVSTAAQTLTLGNTPVAGPQANRIYKNGLKQRNGATFDYTLTGTTLTFTAGVGGQTVNPGDLVEVEYWR